MFERVITHPYLRTRTGTKLWDAAMERLAAVWARQQRGILAAVERVERSGAHAEWTVFDEPFIDREAWQRANPRADAETPRDRALNHRRNRNTGPADQRGIDGHYRRRAQR
jgi:hypothetical protein